MMKIGLGEYISAGLYLATSFVCIAFLIYRYMKHYRRRNEHVVMTFLLWNLFVTGIVEFTKIVLAFYNVPNLIWYQRVGSYLYFIVHTLLSPGFAIYVLLINGAAKNKRKRFFVLLFSELFAVLILVLLNPFNGWIFYYTEVDGYITYNRGWGMTILYVVAIQYLTYAIVFLIKSWNLLKNNYMKGYPFFLVLIVLGIIIQLLSRSIFGEAYEVESIFETIALVGLLLTVDCNDALFDENTRLLNDISYRINIALYHKYRYKYTVITIRFANLDYYRSVLKKETENELIHYIGNTITRITGSVEYYRYKYDTFIIICPKYILQDKAIKEISDFYSKTLTFNNTDIRLQTVVSIAKVPNDIETLEEHLQLIYIKPDLEKELTIVLDEGLKFVKRKSLVDAAIHRAIENRSFEVYYQPIWSKETNKIESAEALCRLIDDEIGFISPAEFIPLAEETGAIIALGDIVIEKVCQDINELKFLSLGVKCIELNLSLYQLRSENLADRILENLKNFNISPSMLNLEITESKDVGKVMEISSFINPLIEKGFSFSLDDYGTAYSNLTSVISVNYKNIKIDSSILWKSMTDFNTKQLLELTIKTFRNFGNNVIQEGVETKEQLDLVINAGANLIQGYYFSKPIPKKEFVEYVKDFNKVENN